MTDKRQIVGPVLRKPEALASREGEGMIASNPAADREQVRLWRRQAEEANTALKAERVLREAAERERDNLLNEGASDGYVWVDRSVYEAAEAALAALQAKHDDLVRILITDGHREDCCDLVNDWCDAWLAANPAPQTEAPGGVPGA